MDALIDLVGGERLPVVELVLPKDGARVSGRCNADEEVVDRRKRSRSHVRTFDWSIQTRFEPRESVSATGYSSASGGEMESRHPIHTVCGRPRFAAKLRFHWNPDGYADKTLIWSKIGRVNALHAMDMNTASLPPGEPDPALLAKLSVVQQVCLGIVALIAVTVFAGWLFPQFAANLPVFMTRMSIPMALTALLCALSLAMSESGDRFSMPVAARYVAAQAGILSILTLLESIYQQFPAVDTLLQADRAPGNTGALPVHSPAAFALLSLSIMLVSSQGPILRRIADGLVPMMCLITMVLLTENLFGAFGLVRLSADNMITPLLLVCLVLLTWVVAMRQTEQGVWSIFVGAGIGSRIARGFAPILLVIPFLIEFARTRLMLRDLVPEQYGAAMLTSLAAGLSSCCCWCWCGGSTRWKKRSTT